MRNFPLLILALFLSSFTYAQRTACGTDDYNNELNERNPAYQAAYEKYLQELTTIAEAPKKESHAKKAVVTIPVVFHIIHEYGAENISKAQILDQMRIINEDFRRLHADTTNTRDIFKSVAVDAEIEFKLATKDPQGNCTDGITRTVSSLTNGGDEEVKKLIRWNYRRYLNVWVIKYVGRSGSDGGTVLGYSRFPYNTSESEDGIIINHEYVGSIGTGKATHMGRTLTHEIGHWLGLLHPFQNADHDDDCGTTNCRTSGDRVCDTPPVLSASFGCILGTNSCSNDSPDLPDQEENFMDYANGRCANMFTEGQKDVMDFYLSKSEYRGQNVSSATATATGINISNPCAPRADFHVVDRYTTVCEGGTLSFEDLSWNGEVTDRVWTFEGGSPSSSTFSNPTVTYNKAGTYKVTLKVSNGLGNSEVTKTEFITVQPEVAELSSPFLETFESVFSEWTWTKETQDEYGWKRLENEGYDNSFATVCVIDEDAPLNAQFNLYSPNFDLSLHRGLSPILSFRAAYSMRESGSAGERIVIYASRDCGESWTVLKSLIGISTLKSVNGNNPDWSPSFTSDWKLQTVNLGVNGFDTSTNVILRFELTSNAGNSVFLDDINVDRNVLSTERLTSKDIGFNIAPNPSSGSFTLKLENIFDTINIEVLDVLGQKVQSLEIGATQHGQIEQSLSIAESGIYLVRVHNSSIDYTKRIVISE